MSIHKLLKNKKIIDLYECMEEMSEDRALLNSICFQPPCTRNGCAWLGCSKREDRIFSDIKDDLKKKRHRSKRKYTRKQNQRKQNQNKGY
jgi:hypothetical protein